MGEVYEILSSLTEVTNSAVQPCDLLHRGSKVLQFDFSGEGKNETGLSNYVNLCPLLCSTWVLAPKLSLCMNAKKLGGVWERSYYDRTTAISQLLEARAHQTNIPTISQPPRSFPLPHSNLVAYLSGFGEHFGQRIIHYFSEKSAWQYMEINCCAVD